MNSPTDFVQRTAACPQWIHALLIGAFISGGFSVHAQSLPPVNKAVEPQENQHLERYSWVFFSEHPDRLQLPVALSPRSLERRYKAALPLTASDRPVRPQDLQTLRNQGYEVVGASRLLNAAVVRGTYVPPADKSVAWTTRALQPLVSCWATEEFDASAAAVYCDRPQQEDGLAGYTYANGDNAIAQINGKVLHDQFYEGQGMLIGVLDGGFRDVDLFGAFARLRSEGRLVFTKDLVQNDDSVFEDSYHGTMVLSIMASDLDGVHVGTAPKANYALFKTENVFTETPLEELHWIRGAEMADSLGADVLNTSLGYSTFDDPLDSHTYADMDGRTTPISRAAAVLARAGLMLVVSAGNEGNGAWKYITAPADADSVLTVGAVNVQGARAGFSSQGPTADGRIKPDVMALGQGCGIINSGGVPSTGNGTSFSGPVMAGMMTCLWQKHSNRSAQDLIYSIKLSSSQGLLPDTLYGHGIPDFDLASILLDQWEQSRPTFQIWSTDDEWKGTLPTPASGKAIVSAVTAEGKLYGYWECDVQTGSWSVPRSEVQATAEFLHWTIRMGGQTWISKSLQLH